MTRVSILGSGCVARSATQLAASCRLRRRLLINLGSSARRQPQDARHMEHLLRKIIPQLVTFCKRRRGVSASRLEMVMA